MYGCNWNEKVSINWRIKKRLDSQFRQKELDREFQSEISNYWMVG